MKIAYLSFEYPDNSSGVGRKIRAQSDIWRAEGHDARHFLLKPHNKPPAHPIAFIAQTYISQPTINLWRNLEKLHHALSEFKPDIIYMRECLYIPGLIKSLGVAPYIIEVNSNAGIEYKLSSRFKSLYHRIFGNKLSRNAAGIVYVSHELKTALHRNKSSAAIVIANGYDFKSVIPAPPTHNTRPAFVFVGSPGQSWHGLDQIESLAKLFPHYDFHLVVKHYTTGIKNITTYDGLYGDDLAALYKRADIAIGSMALYRKAMEEASPLKVREYVAYGLPVIIAYHDTDLSDITATDGILHLENKPDSVLIHRETIEDFTKQWHGRRIDRAPFVSRLSYDAKEQSRLDFFKKLSGI